MRNTNGDQPLEEYVKIADENEKDVSEESALSAWKLLSGAENENIPFGEILPYYEVKAEKYKLIY